MSESNGTNGATAVADAGTVQEAIRSIEAVTPGDKPFSMPEELAKKLAVARESVGRVSKNGQNRDQNYSYVRAEDVVAEASAALNAAGVIVGAPGHQNIVFEDLSSRGGSSGKFVKVEFLFSVADKDTGKGYVTSRTGTATDYPGDKAIYKAETGATKYFLAGLLGMPLGDGNEDPETTVHGKGGSVNKGDSSPASDKQKDLFKKLIGEKNLPTSARAKVIEFVGGSTPKKGAISHAIDQMMNGDALAFARECGWDGVVETAPAPENSQADHPAQPEPAAQETPPAETPAPVTPPDAHPTAPENEGEALVQFCRDKGATMGELTVMLRSLGTDLPPDGEVTNDMVRYAVRNVAVANIARLKQMVMASAESKQAAAEAQTDNAAAPAPAPAETETGEIDPKSPLGKATQRVSALGYKSEFGNLTWLLFDTDQPATLNEEQLTRLTGLLDRASRIGIQQSSVAACVREARKSDFSLEERADRFEGWISTREQNAQATQQAEQAHAAAEAPQDETQQ